MEHINIDFGINSNLNTLIVTDFSDWKHIDQKPSIIEITLPGAISFITKYFDKYKVNRFNSLDLEVNCQSSCDDTELVGLPDGIYTITVKGSPDTFRREYKYLKTDSFQLELDKVYLENFRQPHRIEFIKKYEDILYFLRGAQAYIRIDNPILAGEMFQKAIELTERLNHFKTK